MLKELVISVQSYLNAHQFIKKHRLWKWIIIPGVVYTLFFCISIYFFGKGANSFLDYIKNTTGVTAWLERINSGALSFLFVIANFILWLIIMLFYFSLFKYLWLIVGSPVLAYLSEKTEAIIQGRDFPFNLKQLASDILRGITIAARNTLWQSVYIVAIALMGLVPVVGWATPLLALLVECYYYGFSMLDYSCERRNISASESIYYVGHHRGLAMGNGIIFYLMHALPVVGWVLAPAYAVIAATLSMIEMDKQHDKNALNSLPDPDRAG